MNREPIQFTPKAIRSANITTGNDVPIPKTSGRRSADKLFDNAKVTIEGSGLAAANGIKFVFQDKMAGEHELEVGEHIEIAKSDTKLVINDTMIVETMRTICTDSETELNTGSGAAVKVTLTDGTELYHAVAFG